MILRRLSLRARLLLGVIVLAALGLAVADAATYTSLRAYLLGRVDTTLDAGHVQVEGIAFGGPRVQSGDGSPDAGGRDGRGGPPAQGIDWYQVRATNGRVVAGGFLVGGGSPPQIAWPVAIPTSSSAAGPRHDRVRYFTVASANGSTTYRVRASIEPEHPNSVVLIATSLSGIYGTLHRLLLIELLATAAVLAAIAGLGLWVVRLGLRPLGQIESTAAMIAAGDLTKRVEHDEPNTEIGRLGRSLNAMLAQIESAFTARRESEERLRRFVADASHELRTPLAAVRAYAELFGRGAADRPDDLARAMSGITRESERMSLLVEDLLLLARLDEGRPLEQRPVQLVDVVTDAVDAARVLDVTRPIQLAVEPIEVTGDRDRLRQIMDNLLSNVRAHTPPGTEVAVQLRRAAGNAELTVSDTGPGMSDDDAERVFGRFYRVDSSRTRASGGVGLGLSIVAAVARAHGGAVVARPNSDRGMTFVVTLPARQ